jgi:hypothetical protein
MANSKSKSNHRTSNILFGIGAVLMFAGFIFPGWLWLVNTPGDVEMLPLAAIILVGILGVVLFVAAVVKRFLENKVAERS